MAFKFIFRKVFKQEAAILIEYKFRWKLKLRDLRSIGTLVSKFHPIIKNRYNTLRKSAIIAYDYGMNPPPISGPVTRLCRKLILIHLTPAAFEPLIFLPNRWSAFFPVHLLKQLFLLYHRVDIFSGYRNIPSDL